MKPKEIARTYFDCWKRGDFEGLRAILADDVTFSGPMGTATGADDYVKQLAGFAQQLDDITVEKMLADDHDVLTWFNLHPKGGDPMPVVNWSHVENGRVRQARVTFDPRPPLSQVLQERGVYRTEYSGRMLRENLASD
jgi:ketosteroid isomerase-like protein